MTSTAYRGQAQQLQSLQYCSSTVKRALSHESSWGIYALFWSLLGSFSGVVQNPVSAVFLAQKMNHLKWKLQEIIDNIDESICAICLQLLARQPLEHHVQLHRANKAIPQKPRRFRLLLEQPTTSGICCFLLSTLLFLLFSLYLHNKSKLALQSLC